jgi:two-component SAPR family response regulator
LAILASVKEAITWFRKNDKPDLIFLDIQLSDGSSFEIFKKVEINIPIVFVTAFNQYIIKSFKLYNLDYIVKPYSQDDIYQAIIK